MPDKNYRLAILKELEGVLPRHKEALLERGLKLPLKKVPYSGSGLLGALPPANGKQGWPWTIEVDPAEYRFNPGWPKITVVIPSYEQGEFIEEAIRSVLLQNYPNLELIVMDGGSQDNSKQILTAYAGWLSYWQSGKDSGQGQAINMGFSIADGDYYGWLNSDDFYNEKAFLVLGTEIIQSDKDFYYGDAFSVNKDNTMRDFYKGSLVKNVFLRFGGLIASHSAFWKRAIHQPVWEAMNCNVDGELWIRLVKNTSRKHIKYAIGSVRHYATTKSADLSWKNKWKADDINIERLHGKPPHPRSARAYFFRMLQLLYKKYIY